ncbi:MAG TPA: BadF/BadG/BcrA/BcrD ATPase family protein [Roseateles sp.]|nr:BadF/BadG/BcrA/BcrD ATPase family protein [Roseateles sp.]
MSTVSARAPGAPRHSANKAVRYLIGVDGGGTGTRLRLADRGGRPLGQGEAGPSALGQGLEQAWRHIQQACVQACAQAGLAELDPSECAIGLGLSGATIAEQAAGFLALQPGYARVVLENDGFTTVLGAHGGRPGAVVASGTGAVGEALREDGTRVLISGWGWVTGDEGSGAWLGIKAMRHAQQALDGRVPAGALAQAVWAEAGATRAQLAAWVATAGQHAYAGLAPLVFEAAAQDAVAQGFVDEAVAELEKLAQALDPSGRLPLALCGSIARRVAEQFSGTIRARCVEPQGDSADGALLMIGRALTEQGL